MRDQRRRSAVLTTQLISTFGFHTQIVHSLLFLDRKVQDSSHLLWLYRVSPDASRILDMDESINFGCRFFLHANNVVSIIIVSLYGLRMLPISLIDSIKRA